MSQLRKTIPKNRGSKKREYCIRHAINRAKKRYNLNLTQDDIFIMSKMIREEKYVTKTIQSNTRKICEIMYKDIMIPCVYDKTVSIISSILPLDWRDHVYKKDDFSEGWSIDDD
jgi:hypothetical protein